MPNSDDCDRFRTKTPRRGPDGKSVGDLKRQTGMMCRKFIEQDLSPDSKMSLCICSKSVNGFDVKDAESALGHT